MKQISYKLDAFEGPLDLLLHLIKKNKLNIYDIQISELLAQYMLHIDQMKEQNMDISSEFLEMAARLVYMKSILLLPKHEEAETLKQELTGQLIEYEQCKAIAKMFAKELTFDLVSREPQEIVFDMKYSLQHNISELLQAYIDVVGRKKQTLPPPLESFSGIVSKKIVSVFSKVVSILRKLKSHCETKYDTLFCQSKSKSEMVATFLAILELVKGKRINLDEQNKTISLLDNAPKSYK